MQYPIAIEWGDENTATGIVIPDIPGATTAGDSYDLAYQAALEVAHIMLEEISQKGESVPMPHSVEEHRANPEYEGWGWGMIDIDITPYLGATEKVNVTMPGSVVRQVDEFVKLHQYKSRSVFLTEAAMDKIRSASHSHQ